MKPIKVCNITAAAQRLAQRLLDNPRGMPVKVGWDGQQITVFSGTYSAPAKSLPHERVEIPAGAHLPEIESSLALAVARIRQPLQQTLATRTAQRAPRRGHHWRRGAVDHVPAGD